MIVLLINIESNRHVNAPTPALFFSLHNKNHWDDGLLLVLLNSKLSEVDPLTFHYNICIAYMVDFEQPLHQSIYPQ